MGRRGEIALNPRADPGCLPSLSGTGNQLRLNTQTLTIYFFLSLFFKIFIYLAVAGLSCSMWDLVPRPAASPRGRVRKAESQTLPRPPESEPAFKKTF